jgi:hypothetical protein
MKKIIFLLLISFGAFSQAPREYTKLEKGECGIDHNCKLEYKFDPFESDWEYKIESKESLSKYKLQYTIFKTVHGDGTKTMTFCFMSNLQGCLTSQSYVLILFMDGSGLKLKFERSKVTCGVPYIIVNVTDSDLEQLKTKQMAQIRMHIDQNEDFPITDKGNKAFVKNIECIEKIDMKNN